jgi:uncharacterized protein YdeI (BOF family)
MIKRFLFLVIASAFISSFLLLAGTAILDQVNAATTTSSVQALMLSQSDLVENGLTSAADAKTSLVAPRATASAIQESQVMHLAALLTNPAAYTDAFVTLSGTATPVDDHTILLSDGVNQMLVTLQNAAGTVSAGETLTVTGKFESSPSAGASLDACRMVNGQGMVVQIQSCSYDSNPSWELIATGFSQVAQTKTVAELLNTPSGYFNTNVTLTGMVTVLDDNEFLLNDGTGQILVDLENDHISSLLLTTGDMVTINGTFAFDGTYLDIDACQINSGGSSVTLSGCSNEELSNYADDDSNQGSTSYVEDNSQDDGSSSSASSSYTSDDSYDDNSADTSYSSSSDDDHNGSSNDSSYDSKDDQHEDDHHGDNNDSNDDSKHQDGGHEDGHDGDHGGDHGGEGGDD